MSLLVGLTTWISILLTVKSGLPVASIWLPNALLLAVLLNTPQRQWPVYLLASYLTNLLAHPLAHRDLLGSLGFSLCDSLEVLVAAVALRRYCGEKLDLIENRVLMRFLGICVVGAPAFFALLASGWLCILGRTDGLDEFKMRYAGHALGMITILPTAWALVPGRLRSLFADRMAYRSIALLGLLAGVTLANFTAHAYPFPFIIFTLLLLITFQLGLAGAIAGAFLVSAIALVATTTGHGPLMLIVSASFAHRIQLVQIYIAAIMFSTLLLGVQLEERKRTEIKLRASEQMLREQYAELENYYSAMPVGLALLGRDLRYIRVNDRIASFFGISSQACIGKRLSDLLPEVAVSAMPNYQKVLTSGEPVLNVEIYGASPSRPNQPRHWLANYYPLKIADGSVQKLCVAVVEITERKHSEEALRQANERQELAQQAAGYGVWEWNLQTARMDWSPKLFALFGLDPAGDVPTLDTWLATLHPEDRQVLRTKLGDGPTKCGPFDVEYRIIRPGGEIRWIHTVGRATGEIGRPLRINGVCIDITKQKLAEERLRDFIEERKRAEEQLRLANERLTLAQHAAGSGVWDRDLRTGKIEWSAELFALFGLDSTQFAPTLAAWFGVIHPQDLPATVAQLKEAEEHGTLFDSQYRVIHPGGLVRWINSLGRATYDSLGTPLRMTGICIDITEKKLAEERLRDFSHQLLSVREEEKRRLSGVLHHDVGSIAVSITARLNAAEEDLQRGNSAEALASLQECGRLFADSVSRLKTLAVDLRPPDLDLLGLSAALRQHSQRLARDTELKIGFTDATRGRLIPTEAQTVLFRIAQECLNNVVKHAQASEARVRLATFRGQLRLSVLDNGIGFDRKALAEVAYTHLGIRAMQEMAEATGSTLAITSRPGKGTKISVRIPWEQKEVKVLAQ
jgi:PAS domain S-box-containing protein